MLAAVRTDPAEPPALKKDDLLELPDSARSLAPSPRSTSQLDSAATSTPGGVSQEAAALVPAAAFSSVPSLIDEPAPSPTLGLSISVPVHLEALPTRVAEPTSVASPPSRAEHAVTPVSAPSESDTEKSVEAPSATSVEVPSTASAEDVAPPAALATAELPRPPVVTGGFAAASLLSDNAISEAEVFVLLCFV